MVSYKVKSNAQSKTIADQKQFLEKPKTRTALRRVEKETVSLIVHRDEASLRSTYTDNLSRLSMIFDFDNELFLSNVCERAFRSALKVSLLFRQSKWVKDQPECAPEMNTHHILGREMVEALLLDLLPSSLCGSTLLISS
jgi:hypothetical protein